MKILEINQVREGIKNCKIIVKKNGVALKKIEMGGERNMKLSSEQKTLGEY